MLQAYQFTGSVLRMPTLRDLREKVELTQDRLAEASGVPQSTISALEGGGVTSPRYDTLESLSKPLGVSVAEVAAAVRESAGATA